MKELNEAYANLPNEPCTILQDHVKLATSVMWTCTKEMRWLEKEVVYTHTCAPGTATVNSAGELVTDTQYGTIETILQQKWIRNTGEVDWRDIPVVKE